MTPARAVLWDLGNTLVDWDPRRLYAKLLPDESAVDEFLGGVCTMDWHGAHDRGASMAENRRGLVAAHPDKADLIRAWDERWDEMFDGWVAGMDALFAELDAAGVAQYALSNLPAEKWSPLLAMYPALERLRETVVSGAEGVAKPDRRIYAITAERIGHRPEETVFIDDKPANVAAAAEAGFPGLVFTDAATTRAALRKAGLPV